MTVPRVLVFGGTFDPFHNGHMYMLEQAINALGCDKVLIIPNFMPVNKSEPMFSAYDRYKMIDSNTHYLPQIKHRKIEYNVLDIEIKSKAVCYTVDTMRELKKAYPKEELFFLMGSDNLFEFHLFKNPGNILKYVNLCVIRRDNKLVSTYNAYIKNKLNELFYERVIIIKSDPLEVSSTVIRESIKNNKSIKGLVPEFICDYIKGIKCH